MTVQNFAHFGICVRDPERSMHFYCDLLGFERVSKLVVTDGPSATLVQLEPLDLHSYFIERDGVRYAGTHLIIDLLGAERLDDLAHIEQALRDSVEAARATLLHIHLHHFTPNGGVSGVAVLAESAT